MVTTETNFQHAVERHSIDPNKLRVVPNYVDVSLFSPAPGDSKTNATPTLLFVGRLSPKKNIDALLNALAFLKTRASLVPKLTIIGNGRLRQALIAKAHKLALPVSFLGNLPNDRLPGEFRKADIFILPSLYEGHPKALLEAMSCGLPCIGSDVEGIRQVLKHRVTGYLCQTSPESIADAIETVLDDMLLQTQLGKNAR